MAVLSPTAVATSTQVLPSSVYCHLPCVEIAALPTMASALWLPAALPPPVMALCVSVASP